MASINILVVDDDTELRHLLGDYLRKNGYQVTLAADGKDMRKSLEGIYNLPTMMRACGVSMFPEGLSCIATKPLVTFLPTVL